MQLYTKIFLSLLLGVAAGVVAPEISRIARELARATLNGGARELEGGRARVRQPRHGVDELVELLLVEGDPRKPVA